VLTNDANLYSSELTLKTAQQQEALSLGAALQRPRAAAGSVA
jgi:hypothetical protein